MIRGHKEDMSLLPVAFMDMNMYVSVAKSINNMILFGDMMKSVWFVGFNVRSSTAYSSIYTTETDNQ